MWELRNKTPYAAERTWAVDKDGRSHWIVAVRGTFDIAPDGTPKLAEEQLPPEPGPVWNGDAGKSSLRFDADLAAFKPGTDVVVNATAHAPRGRPTTECKVTFKLGDRSKTLEILGDRTYKRDVTGRVTPGQTMPFVAMPITYERAYGGYDDSDPDPTKHLLFPPNPFGVGVQKGATLIGRSAPNVALSSGSAKKMAAGLGAIAGHWEPRVSFAGTYDAAWLENRRPLPPLDYDPRHLLSAPADQQFIPHLRGGERVELHGMTLSGAMAVTLPQAELEFSTKIVAAKHEHHGRLVTVVIEPEESRLFATWQTTLPVTGSIDDLDYTSIRDRRPMS